MTVDKLASFYRLIAGVPDIQRSSKNLSGTIPLRAYQYCLPFTIASGFGWNPFSPASLDFYWDSSTIFWKRSESQEWFPLSAVAVQQIGLGMGPAIDGHTGQEALLPPAINKLNENGIFQLFTGYCVRSAPGWSLLIRGIVNQPFDERYQILEGVIESSLWFGPLIINIQIRKSDLPIRFTTETPIATVTPVHCDSFDENSLNEVRITEVDQFTTDDWKEYNQALFQNVGKPKKKGAYKNFIKAKRMDAAEHGEP